MKTRGTQRQRVDEVMTLLDLLRDIRDELRYLRQDGREALHSNLREAPDADELLTVEQVATQLQVIPPTVRTWIQSGALPASRPGNGKKPGCKYRVRRADLEAFVAASQASRPSPVLEGGQLARA
jgi:excisionase family DNA binding protein